ncbi:MAG: hypothetical protein ACLTGI_07745 [Hoylesella buccalis]
MACAFEGPTHNYYLFSVFHRSLMGDRFGTETEVFWNKYVGNDPRFSSYRWSREVVMDVAKRRGDTEMMGYLRLLNSYIDASVFYDAWEYPSKEKIAQSQATMRELQAEARKYKWKKVSSAIYADGDPHAFRPETISRGHELLDAAGTKTATKRLPRPDAKPLCGLSPAPWSTS